MDYLECNFGFFCICDYRIVLVYGITFSFLLLDSRGCDMMIRLLFFYGKKEFSDSMMYILKRVRSEGLLISLNW